MKSRSPDIWKEVRSGLTQGERAWLVALARKTGLAFESPVMVNIGIFHGCSMHCLRAGCKEARLVGVDIRKCRITSPDLLDAEFIIADSGRCHEDFDSKIHLLFVDGGHMEDEVTNDIKWTAKIVLGGYAVFHDYSRRPPRWYVGIAVRAWLEKEGRNWRNVARVGTLRALQRIGWR